MPSKSKAILIVTAVCVLFIWILPFLGFFPSIHGYAAQRGLFGIYGTILAFIIVNILAKVDGEKGVDIGLVWRRGTLSRFMKGLLIGFAIAGIMFSILILATDYSFAFDPDMDSGRALWGLLSFIPLALMEEIIFRGYPFMKLKNIFGLRITQIVMAIMFAYYHDRTGATLHMQLLGPGVWAFIYGIAAVWSNGIALPTGIHTAVNMVLALVGTKHGDFVIWNIELTNSNVESAEPRMFMVGYVLQIGLLALGVGLTEWWIRKMPTATRE